jgi:hypothetical protein
LKTYISNIIPKIQRFSKKLDDLTLLKNQNWVLINEKENTKNVFIFRDNNQVLIAKNGKVKKENWEYIGTNNLLIEINNESYLFNHGFLDENIFALKMDSTSEYLFFVNESKYEFELNSIEDINDFLLENYLNKNPKPESNQYIGDFYKAKLIKSRKILLGPKLETYKIKFNEGLKGEIYVLNNGESSYFIDNVNFTSKLKRYYENSESCILALHYFLKTGNIKDENYIKTMA